MIVQHLDFFDEHWFKVFIQSFDASIDSVVITSPSPEEHFLYVNDSFKAKTGYSEAQLVGKSPRILQGEKTNRATLDELKATLARGEDFVGKNINYHKNGTSYRVHWFITSLKDPQGNIVAHISYQKNITQSVFEHNQLKLLSSAVDQVEQMIVITDLDAKIVYSNASFINQYGFDYDEVVGGSMRMIKSDKQTKSFYKDMWSTIIGGVSFHGIFVNRHKDGTLFFEKKTISPLKNEEGNIEFYVSIAQDITQLMHEKSEFQDKAYRDSLTGLYNRFKLEEVAQHRYNKFKSYPDESTAFSLILIDLDNFKSINDTYGHDQGDEVLVHLAKIVQNQLRSDDLLVRWGGEEFLICIDKPIDKALIVAQKVALAIEKELSIGSRTITASLGISQITAQDDMASLFKRVDKALYRSKQNGKNQVTQL